jgi:hypothetical protein
MCKVRAKHFGGPESQYKVLWDFNFKIWHISSLAAVSRDNPAIDPVLYFTALEGCYESTISLHVRVMTLKVLETQRDGTSAAGI